MYVFSFNGNIVIYSYQIKYCSPLYFAILCMYRRQRARVGDLSHFGVSHTQWVRVGSPVMFNQWWKSSFYFYFFVWILREQHLSEEALAKQSSTGGHPQHTMHGQSEWPTKSKIKEKSVLVIQFLRPRGFMKTPKQSLLHLNRAWLNTTLFSFL